MVTATRLSTPPGPQITMRDCSGVAPSHCIDTLHSSLHRNYSSLGGQKFFVRQNTPAVQLISVVDLLRSRRINKKIKNLTNIILKK